MSTIFECDWCGDRFDDRAAVASADITIQSTSAQCHMCYSCLPDWISDQLEPVDRNTAPVTDGGTYQYPEPEYLDCVEAPDGHECQMWSGEGPTPCDNEAEYLVVYDGTMYDGVTTPRNVLACRECFVPPTEIRTDGGLAVRLDHLDELAILCLLADGESLPELDLRRAIERHTAMEAEAFSEAIDALDAKGLIERAGDGEWQATHRGGVYGATELRWLANRAGFRLVDPDDHRLLDAEPRRQPADGGDG